MNLGDLVTPLVPENHGNRRIRLYDVPESFINDSGRYIIQHVVAKFNEGQFALVIGRTIDSAAAEWLRVVLEGNTGWVPARLVRRVS